MSARPMGLVLNMPADEYHAVDAVSNSALSVMNRSMWHYWQLYRNPARPPRVATPAMLAGTLAHACILEPQSVAARYAIKPSGHDGRTKAGREWAESVAGLEVIAAEQMQTAISQSAAFDAVPELAAMFSGEVHAEASFFWIDKATGVYCKARPDLMQQTSDGKVRLLDVKTTGDVAPEAFGRTVNTYGYHRQQAHYSTGVEAVTGMVVESFVFGVVSSAFPFLAVPYLLDDETAAQGVGEVATLLQRYADCDAKNEWPAYGRGYQVTGLPVWARASQETEVGYV